MGLDAGFPTRNNSALLDWSLNEDFFFFFLLLHFSTESAFWSLGQICTLLQAFSLSTFPLKLTEGRSDVKGNVGGETKHDAHERTPARHELGMLQ